MINARKLLNSLRQLWSRANDFWLNIDTSDALTPDDLDPVKAWPFAKPSKLAKHKDNLVYQAVDYRNLRRLRGLLRPGPNDVFYDIGCGKGRVVCVFAQVGQRRVVGIELDQGLCESARRNAKSLRGRKTPIEVRCADAATTDLSDGTIYFMYNPFGEATMRDVLNNIHGSLKSTPRRLRVAYCNAKCTALFEAAGWLHSAAEFKTFTGRKVILYDTEQPGMNTI